MIKEGLTFDDVLLVPEHSEIDTRSSVDLSVRFGKQKFKHPIIPANMKTVTGRDMAWAVTQSGGLAILHRFMSLQDQLDIAEDLLESGRDGLLALSVGVKDEDKRNLASLVHLGISQVCIDVAHGDSKQCISMIEYIKKEYPEVWVIAGNVATGSGAQRLWEAGADVVKVGVGPGSLCTTRIETGNGVPQLTALMDVRERRAEIINKIGYTTGKINNPMHIIADGGIKSAGDIVKALCFADMVMVGNLFAGCEEAPGERRVMGGTSYKEYVGSSTHKASHVEGVAAMVPYQGTYQQVLTKLLEGLRSGCSYQGASNLVDLRDNPKFVRITPAGLKESHPHDVILR